MTREDAWMIFKNTGSVEAYITFSQSKNLIENNNNANDNKDQGNNNKNQ